MLTAEQEAWVYDLLTEPSGEGIVMDQGQEWVYMPPDEKEAFYNKLMAKMKAKGLEIPVEKDKPSKAPLNDANNPVGKIPGGAGMTKA